MNRLRRIRAAAYESLNQIQHEYLILNALQWLRDSAISGEDLEWSWNPRQTGDSSEPDLRAMRESETVISAEATTSAKPIGVIDSRMHHTLAKLGRMPGRRFYFVQTAAMARRAQTKIAKNGWDIEVVQCDESEVGGHEA